MKGFRDFILRGNVVDLAVAVIIGAAFGAVVTALTTDIITPFIAAHRRQAQLRRPLFLRQWRQDSLRQLPQRRHRLPSQGPLWSTSSSSSRSATCSPSSRDRSPRHRPPPRSAPSASPTSHSPPSAASSAPNQSQSKPKAVRTAHKVRALISRAGWGLCRCSLASPWKSL